MLVKNCYELRVKYSALRLVKFQVLCTTQWSRRPTDGQTDKGIRDFERFIFESDLYRYVYLKRINNCGLSGLIPHVEV
jgi:hypothetical protein